MKTQRRRSATAGLVALAGLFFTGLLAHGADVNIKDIDGDRALDFAVKNGHQVAAGLLRKEAE